MNKIIIVTPPYAEHSNGIKSLHKIAHTINQVGGDAHLMFLNGGIVCGGREWTSSNLNTPCLRDDDRHLLRSSIVMYPEIIPGNPSCATKIVRYLGNKDGLLTGRKMGVRENDFLLAHSRIIDPNANCILFNAEFNAAFNDRGTISAEFRHLDATYIGKGFIHGRGFPYGECPVLPDTFLIERMWPQGAGQLAYLLRRTRYFHTYDPMSATNVEAVLCGAVLRVLRYEPWTEEEFDGSELGIIPRMGVDFSFSQFKEDRSCLISRIAELNASWDARVRGFVDQVESFLGMKRLIQTSYDDLLEHIDAIFPKIVIACSYSIGRFKAEDIIEQIKINQMQIWLAFDDENLEGFILTQILDYPQTKSLRILCLMGVAVEGWQRFMSCINDWLPFVRQVEAWAKGFGCTLSQIECPATWELYLRDMGYKRGHVLLDREI